MKVYKTLPTKIGEYGELEISVSYQLGGMNYFSGRTEARGYYVHLSPVSRSSSPHMSSIVSRTLLGSTHESGYKIKLLECSRQSAKRLATAEKIVEPLIEKFPELYASGKHQEIYQLITKAL